MIDRLRDRHGYREGRAAAEVGIQPDAVGENARKTLHDGETQAEAAGDSSALLQAMKLLEDLAALDDGNADAGVVDADLHPMPAPPATDQHAAARGVVDGVGNQVLQQPA